MTKDDYDAKRTEYGDEFSAKMGAEGIQDLLNIDLDGENRTPAQRLEMSGSETKIKKTQAPQGAGSLQKVRHQARMDGAGRAAGAAAGPAPAGAAGRRPFATSDLNDLYAASSTATTACAACWNSKRPTSSCATKSACCRKPWTRLLDNGRRGKAMTGANKRRSSRWPT